MPMSPMSAGCLLSHGWIGEWKYVCGVRQILIELTHLLLRIKRICVGHLQSTTIVTYWERDTVLKLQDTIYTAIHSQVNTSELPISWQYSPLIICSRPSALIVSLARMEARVAQFIPHSAINYSQRCLFICYNKKILEDLNYVTAWHWLVA